MFKKLSQSKYYRTLFIIFSFLGTALILHLFSKLIDHFIPTPWETFFSFIYSTYENLSDSIERETFLNVAVLSGESIELFTSRVIFVVFFTIITFSAFAYLIIFFSLRKVTSPLDDTNDSIEFKDVIPKIPVPKPVFFLILIILIYFPGIVLVDYAKAIYTSARQSHYLQLKRIITPFTDTKKLQHFDSEFSLISNRNEYNKIMTNMIIIAESENIQLPEHILVYYSENIP